MLVPGKAESLALWTCAQQLARATGIEVDLLDLRATSTVMAHQVLTTGECLYALEPQAGSWAAFALNEKLKLDAARAPLLAQIEREGTVHGR
ncbi:hypothetical protein [Pseudorhodoferax sp.]|uniref:hypothetical protein n=1 Tax=Pseudorhodoferax sp. TaxID=1993553 RepID=UPI002DD6709A|nr:hypothetical protein [Pseudorhodoferax sp.]